MRLAEVNWWIVYFLNTSGRQYVQMAPEMLSIKCLTNKGAVPESDLASKYEDLTVHYFFSYRNMILARVSVMILTINPLGYKPCFFAIFGIFL